MALFGITASNRGLGAAEPGVDIEAGLRALLDQLPADAPIVVLVHGYKFDPSVPEADPHGSLYACQPKGDDRRVRSWPKGLGFGRDRVRRVCASALAGPR